MGPVRLFMGPRASRIAKNAHMFQEQWWVKSGEAENLFFLILATLSSMYICTRDTIIMDR